jgi:hypothetical protein
MGIHISVQFKLIGAKCITLYHYLLCRIEDLLKIGA